jgi:hypothetical protein
MTDYMSLEEIVSRIVLTIEHQNAALFAQGDVLLAAMQPEQLAYLGYATKGHLLRDLAGMAGGLSRRVAYNRMKVARTFEDAQLREIEVDYEVFLAAAGTDDPEGWLLKAQAEQLGGAELRDQYAWATGIESRDAVEIVTVCRAETVHVVEFAGKLWLPVPESAADQVARGDEVQISVRKTVYDETRSDDVQVPAHEEAA